MRAAVIFAALALSACGGGPSRGPVGAPPPTQTIAPEAMLYYEFDANRDRIVERAELEAGIGAAWSEAAGDQAAIGQLAIREWLHRVLGADGFAFSPTSFDADFNGTVTREEFAAELNESFDRLDSDNDGRLTRAEFVSRRGRVDPAMPPPQRNDNQQPPGAPPPGR
ncbi:MAG: EF-hand domain-containing protein [Hyphomonadaceae bacterium]